MQSHVAIARDRDMPDAGRAEQRADDRRDPAGAVDRDRAGLSAREQVVGTLAVSDAQSGELGGEPGHLCRAVA